MEKLESLLDNILGAKMAKLFGGPNVSLLERMEVRCPVLCLTACLPSIFRAQHAPPYHTICR